MVRSARVLALTAVALVLAAAAGPARADVSGLGPGDSLGAPAGPMQTGVQYSGAFTSSDDNDHVLFSVATPDTTTRFIVTNTYGGCAADNYCPIWGTLLDTAGRQLGGEGSQAGTGPVGPGTSDSIVWTFPAAGNYILVLESNGDLATYQFRVDEVTAGGTGGGAPGSGGLPALRPITRLQAVGRQRGTAALARLTLQPRATSVQAALLADGRRLGRSSSRPVRVGYLTRGRLGPGVVSLRVPLFAHVRRAVARLKSLRVRLVVTVRRSGSRPIVLQRAVLLRSPPR